MLSIKKQQPKDHQSKPGFYLPQKYTRYTITNPSAQSIFINQLKPTISPIQDKYQRIPPLSTIRPKVDLRKIKNTGLNSLFMLSKLIYNCYQNFIGNQPSTNIIDQDISVDSFE